MKLDDVSSGNLYFEGDYSSSDIVTSPNVETKFAWSGTVSIAFGQLSSEASLGSGGFVLMSGPYQQVETVVPNYVELSSCSLRFFDSSYTQTGSEDNLELKLIRSN
jgi:hypothetical protein